jgi:hypothetical protein
VSDSGERRSAAAQDEARQREEREQRKQQKRQQDQQEASGIRPSPPPYEVPETPLERLGPGMAYLFGVIGGAFLLNLALLVLIAGGNGG